MLSLTHAVVGGALGAEINQPAIAYAVGIFAHFVADKIPHFWPETEKGKNVVKILDSVLTIGVLVALFLIYPDTKSIFWGAMGGATVDAVLVLSPLEKAKVGLWHTNRQIHKSNYFYLGTDLILIIIAASWLLFGR